MMKIIYGKASCVLQGSQITEVVIKYKGNPYLAHSHLEIISVLNKNQAQVKNINSNSLILHGNNQIHIGYKTAVDGELELFKYTGYFKIVSAKVNGDNVTIETKNIDFWNKIDSKWDNLGKPEQYRGAYRNGKGATRKPEIRIPKHLRGKIKPNGKSLKTTIGKLTTTKTGGY